MTDHGALPITLKRVGESEHFERSDGTRAVLEAADPKNRTSRFRLDYMFDNGTITGPQATAGTLFSQDFDKANFPGDYAKTNLFRVESSNREGVSDSIVSARRRVRAALDSLGQISRDCAWDVLGRGMTVKDWVFAYQRIKLDQKMGRAVVMVTLDTLAHHYRISS